MLAGWLFADLLLVLFITVMASLPAPAVVHTAIAVKVKPVKHNPPPLPRVLERNPQTFYVNVSPSAVSDPATHKAAVGQLVSELKQQLVKAGLEGRQAGFVLVFAYGPIGGIGQAITTAQSVLGSVRATENGFKQVSGVGYWMGSGNFEFKIFFFA